MLPWSMTFPGIYCSPLELNGKGIAAKSKKDFLETTKF
jgi:hypothetical protein